MSFRLFFYAWAPKAQSYLIVTINKEINFNVMEDIFMNAQNNGNLIEQEILVATFKKIFVIYKCILVCRYSRADCAVTFGLCLNLRLFF